eukprot:SAG22_NODE_122_length_18920_cov_23.494076_2_plen_290_part_00
MHRVSMSPPPPPSQLKSWPHVCGGRPPAPDSLRELVRHVGPSEEAVGLPAVVRFTTFGPEVGLPVAPDARQANSRRTNRDEQSMAYTGTANVVSARASGHPCLVGKMHATGHTGVDVEDHRPARLHGGAGGSGGAGGPRQGAGGRAVFVSRAAHEQQRQNTSSCRWQHHSRRLARPEPAGVSRSPSHRGSTRRPGSPCPASQRRCPNLRTSACPSARARASPSTRRRSGRAAPCLHIKDWYHTIRREQIAGGWRRRRRRRRGKRGGGGEGGAHRCPSSALRCAGSRRPA